MIFKYSNVTGLFPTLWKTSYVTPVPKKGVKQNIATYRSIVKNSIFGKMLDPMNEVELSTYLKIYIVNKPTQFYDKEINNNKSCGLF